MAEVMEVGAANWDAEVVSADVPVVVDFWAPWCGPCRMLAPEIEKLAARDTGAKFVKLNIDENRDLAIKYGVMSIPTIIRFDGGQEGIKVIGARGADALARQLGL